MAMYQDTRRAMISEIDKAIGAELDAATDSGAHATPLFDTVTRRAVGRLRGRADMPGLRRLEQLVSIRFDHVLFHREGHGHV